MEQQLVHTVLELRLFWLLRFSALADLQDERYAQGRGFITKAVNGCHTSSLITPEDKEQAQQIHVSPISSVVQRETEQGKVEQRESEETERLQPEREENQLNWNKKARKRKAPKR